MPDRQYEDILVDVADDVCTITLNRPHRLNAWTGRMSAELYDAIDTANGNPNVGAIVLTGAGRGFCAGADIKDSFQARLDDSGESAAMRGDWIELVRSSKPLIAAVNGACVGVGATMILPMDVIVASDQARFGMAFVKMGVTPELGSSHFLVARVGFGRASEMCLTGRLYSGEEAFNLGLADRLVPHDQLMSQATELAREIAGNPAPHLRWVKQLITANGFETDIKAVQKLEGEVLAKAYESEEHREAVDAFISKRTPDFKTLR
ncbi:MAG: enoyl-CoA hydratase-related protein [Gammaproteobacteria bacterium]|nr:enoyl-CoA hydratase-related protein [Gammaproteobacteria bacterium]